MIDKMKDFIQQAKRGRKFVYHTSEYVNVQPVDIFTVAYNAYKAGHVTLVQKRAGKRGDNRFDYMMIKL